MLDKLKSWLAFKLFNLALFIHEDTIDEIMNDFAVWVAFVDSKSEKDKAVEASRLVH